MEFGRAVVAMYTAAPGSVEQRAAQAWVEAWQVGEDGWQAVEVLVRPPAVDERVKDMVQYAAAQVLYNKTVAGWATAPPPRRQHLLSFATSLPSTLFAVVPAHSRATASRLSLFLATIVLRCACEPGGGEVLEGVLASKPASPTAGYLAFLRDLAVEVDAGGIARGDDLMALASMVRGNVSVMLDTVAEAASAAELFPLSMECLMEWVGASVMYNDASRFAVTLPEVWAHPGARAACLAALACHHPSGVEVVVELLSVPSTAPTAPVLELTAALLTHRPAFDAGGAAAVDGLTKVLVGLLDNHREVLLENLSPAAAPTAAALLDWLLVASRVPDLAVAERALTIWYVVVESMAAMPPEQQAAFAGLGPALVTTLAGQLCVSLEADCGRVPPGFAPPLVEPKWFRRRVVEVMISATSSWPGAPVCVSTLCDQLAAATNQTSAQAVLRLAVPVASAWVASDVWRSGDTPPASPSAGFTSPGGFTSPRAAGGFTSPRSAGGFTSPRAAGGFQRASQLRLSPSPSKPPSASAPDSTCAPLWASFVKLLARVPTLPDATGNPTLTPSVWRAAVEVLDALMPWLCTQGDVLHAALDLLLPSMESCTGAALGCGDASLWAIAAATHDAIASAVSVLCCPPGVPGALERLAAAYKPAAPMFGDGLHVGCVGSDAAVEATRGFFTAASRLAVVTGSDVGPFLVAVVSTASRAPDANSAAGCLSLVAAALSGAVPAVDDDRVDGFRERARAAVLPGLQAVWGGLEVACRRWLPADSGVQSQLAAIVYAGVSELGDALGGWTDPAARLLCEAVAPAVGGDGPPPRAMQALSVLVCSHGHAAAAQCLALCCEAVVASYGFDWTRPPGTPELLAEVVAAWEPDAMLRLLQACEAAMAHGSGVGFGALPSAAPSAALTASLTAAGQVLQMSLEMPPPCIAVWALHVVAAVFASSGSGLNRRCVLAAADCGIAAFRSGAPQASLLACVPAVTTGCVLGLNRATFAAASMVRPCGSVLFAMLRHPTCVLVTAAALQCVLPVLPTVDVDADTAAAIVASFVAVASRGDTTVHKFRQLASTVGLVLRKEAPVDMIQF